MISYCKDMPKPCADLCPEARFRVAWRHSSSGMVSVGKMSFEDYPAAAEFAHAMNLLWPDVAHWPVPADDSDGRAC